MALVGSQQLREQYPAPARRCGTEGRTGHKGREGGNGDGNRDGRDGEYGDEHEGRDGVENGSGNGKEDMDENRDEGGGERGPGSEYARRWATRRNNKQSQPQDPTPQQDRRIMLRINGQGWEAKGMIGEDKRDAKKRKKPERRRCIRNVGNRGDLRGNGKT